MNKYSDIVVEHKNNFHENMHTHDDLAPVTIVRNHFVTGFKNWKLGGRWLAFLCLDTQIPEEINTSRDKQSEFLTARDNEEIVGHGENPNVALYDLWKKVIK